MTSSFTGRTRRRRTRPSVRVFDRLARTLITVGGVGTIVAVLGVFLFLVWVAVPLFGGARSAEGRVLSPPWAERVPLHAALDESGEAGWVLDPDGTLRLFSLVDGAPLDERPVDPERELRAASFLPDDDLAMLGFEDGGIVAARIGFETSFLDADEVPDELEGLLEHAGAQPFHDGLLSRTPQGKLRLLRLAFEPLGERALEAGPVVGLGHVQGARGPTIAALTEDGGTSRLLRLTGRSREDFMTGEVSFRLGSPRELPMPEKTSGGAPRHVGISGPGSDIFLAWSDGHLARIRISGAESFLAEFGRLTAPGNGLSAVAHLLGNNTLLWADDAGRLGGGFPVDLGRDGGDPLDPVERDRSRAREGFRTTRSYDSTGAAVRSLTTSSRSRLLMAGLDDGGLVLFDGTSGARLADWSTPGGQPIDLLALAPREDGYAAFTGGRIELGTTSPGYPEANFASLFRPVWYERYSEPSYIWQSSSASDDFEPKLSLIPLIFGTLKATLYSMLFGAPLALLAAIYTSEFLSPRARSTIKPTIELMASLPSVVLGFLAALVIAPFVEEIVPAVLSAFFTVPFVFLLAAHGWQLLPPRFQRLHEGWRFPLMIATLPVSFAFAAALGPWLEAWFFAGDLKGWLAWGLDRPEASADSPFANAAGGWMILWVPFTAMVVSFAVLRWVNPRLREATATVEASTMAWIQLAKFALGCTATVLLALALSFALDAVGLDPRGSYIDTYVQRNALVVGFVMGFAIIPIIYTIADDALSTVPDHLRSASLAAGATPWQTATRIIIPTAMSGLFSALMVGLGRAVGETMIVLMAAGNTPVLEWNIFEGFRTLSANIAVELPEAVRDSGHYRTLFLSALVLFAMTFAVNTVAELVRLRFRKRAYQL